MLALTHSLKWKRKYVRPLWIPYVEYSIMSVMKDVTMKEIEE